MGSFENLEVWHESRQLVVNVYRITQALPPEEKFGLCQQTRSAAVSVSSNIAEGSGRGGQREFHAFIRIARGSVHELISQLHLTSDLGLIDRESTALIVERANRVGRMLSGILRGQVQRPAGNG